jgi:predicted Zn-dependent peptidase
MSLALRTQISTLPNGLRVASLAMPGLETASVGLYVDAGSRFETAANNGVAHMLEHMVFKGTLQRSARAIAEEIEAVGGHLNAYTTRDHTAFYARVLGDDVALGVDLLSDMLRRPRFDPTDVDKEREVILQELGQALDTPDDIVFDHLSEVAYPEQPIGRSILGSDASLDRLDADALRTYLDGHYRGSSVVLAGAGKVDHQALCELAQAHGLADLPSGTRPAPVDAAYTGGLHHDDRALEQTHIAIGLPAVSYADPNYYAAMLFSTLLGGGMSSRLFQDLREERGLVYSVFSSVTPYAETGLFSLYLGTGPEQAGEAVKLAMDALHSAAAQVDVAELGRAKAQAKAGLFMSLESPSALSEQIGRHLLLFGRVLSTDEIVSGIDACTPEQVAAVGARMAASAPATAVVGPRGTLSL